MDKDLIKKLLKIEIDILMKKGVSFEDAVNQAGDKMKEAMKEAEYETYCSERGL